MENLRFSFLLTHYRFSVTNVIITRFIIYLKSFLHELRLFSVSRFANAVTFCTETCCVY